MKLRALATGAIGFTAALMGVSSTAAVQQLATAGKRHLTLPSAPPKLSADCGTKRIPGERFRRPLRALRQAVRTSRPVKVLAIGSSSTAGIGASSYAKAYVAQLETTLEGALKGLDVKMIERGQGGEEAEGAATRMKREIEQDRPDLVVWQVGTNDAIGHVSVERFTQCLRTQLKWLKARKIDVVLVDPQYGDELASDAHYGRVVTAIADVAREARVLLVDRFEAMRETARQRGEHFYLTADNLHLNDTGHRCMAEQLARSIVAGLLSAEAENASVKAADTVPSPAPEPAP
ncbi:MAG TPA: SGNH/GDSL hydrolase family protein [Hyphomicrobiaceae bacterium]|nr:SGNH/GDSL hydrolase family protein [Hyphomicrobiaceae bacterium]